MIDTTLIDSLSGAHPLFRIFPGRGLPQRAFIEIDHAGHIRADYDHDDSHSTMAYIWDRKALRIAISPYLSADLIRNFIHDELTRFERVHAGHARAADGTYHLSEDAWEALEELRIIASSMPPDYDYYDLP